MSDKKKQEDQKQQRPSNEEHKERRQITEDRDIHVNNDNTVMLDRPIPRPKR